MAARFSNKVTECLENFSADDIVAALRGAFEEEGAQAVVLLINSPGGSPVQAGIVNDEIMRLKAKHKKPIYAVVEESCASAAYYIAVAADRIFVDKASIVGSIGVLIIMADSLPLLPWMKIAAGSVSILGALITIVATASKWNEKSAQHHAAAAAYGTAYRRIEQALAMPPTSDEARMLVIERLRKELAATEITMTKLQPFLVEELSLKNMTITSAIKAGELHLLDRHRLQTWQRKLYAEIESAAELLLPAKS